MSNATTFVSQFTFEGITDEVSTCDCCGKQNLKRAVALSVNGDVSYYGTTCAARLLKIPAKDVTKSAKSAQAAKDAAIQAEKQRRYDEDMEKWSLFLFSRTGERNIALAIQSLGGFAAARAAYRGQ